MISTREVFDGMAGFTGIFAATVISLAVIHSLMRLVGWVVQHSIEQHRFKAASSQLDRRHQSSPADQPNTGKTPWYSYLLGTDFPPGHRTVQQFRSIQVGLGRSLVLALEILLAAEIIHTVTLMEHLPGTSAEVETSSLWNGIGVIAATAALRVVLSFFLSVEIQRHEAASSTG